MRRTREEGALEAANDAVLELLLRHVEGVNDLPQLACDGAVRDGAVVRVDCQREPIFHHALQRVAVIVGPTCPLPCAPDESSLFLHCVFAVQSHVFEIQIQNV